MAVLFPSPSQGRVSDRELAWIQPTATPIQREGGFLVLLWEGGIDMFARVWKSGMGDSIVWETRKWPCVTFLTLSQKHTHTKQWKRSTKDQNSIEKPNAVHSISSFRAPHRTVIIVVIIIIIFGFSFFVVVVVSPIPRRESIPTIIITCITKNGAPLG